MKKIIISAPGKLMLFGEHSVVYGYPSIVTAMDTRMYVDVQVIENGADVIIAPQVKESKFVDEAIKAFKKKFNIKSSVRVKTRSDFSHNVGLGSSSAVTVATFKALSDFFGKNLTKKEIFDLSYKVTINIQGIGSGFDIAAAAFGGTLYYVFGGKVIEKIKTEKLPLVIGYSGIKADTPTLIRQVRKTYEQDKKRIEGIFKNITDIVEQAKKDIVNKNYPHLGSLMTKNHKLLQGFGVSTEKLDAMVKASIDTGAYGAKLSGAGGGDCMIALVSAEKRKTIEKAIKSVGGEIVNSANNAEGAVKEAQNSNVTVQN